MHPHQCSLDIPNKGPITLGDNFSLVNGQSVTIWISLTFALAALIYSSIGFGGGSTYTAILLVSDIDILLVPILSLICNLVVTSSGVWRAYKANLYRGSNLLPILCISVPLAFLGGITPVDINTLKALLGVALLLSGLQMGYTSFRQSETSHLSEFKRKSIIGSAIGGITGYISGVVGIGGGIFLAPILHMIGWANPRKIAAISSAYIAANSLAALAGKFISTPKYFSSSTFHLVAPLVIGVVAASWIGHKLMIGILPETLVKRLTALLIIIVAIRLLFGLFQG